MLELRAYQKECLEAIKTKYEAGVQRQVAVLATGTGKTIIFCHLISYLINKTGKKALILAHREELLKQAKDKLHRIDKTLRIEIEKAEDKASPKADVVIASVPTLGRTGSKRIQKFKPDEFCIIVVDECFPAGTLIDGKPIEKIKVGEKVQSFNFTKNIIEQKTVTHVFRKTTNTLLKVTLKNGKEIICTPNHPFYSDGKWIPASLLKSSSMVWYNQYNEKVATDEMSRMRETLCPSYQNTERHSKKGQNILWKYLQKNVFNKTLFNNNVKNEQKICLRANEKKQSDVRPCKYRENEEISDRKNVLVSRGEWEIDEGTDEVGYILKLLQGTIRVFNYYHSCKKSISLITSRLQSRFGRSESKISHRSGWKNPFTQKVEISRSQEDGSIREIGVDGIKVYQPRSTKKSGVVCKNNYVYNLEVEGNNNYFANGVLVHNCHHTSADSYKNILRYFGLLKDQRNEYGKIIPENNSNKTTLLLGATATPSRNDNKGIDSIFDEVSYEYSIIPAIQDGWLVKIKAYRVNTYTDISKVHRVAGDFSLGELSNAVNTEDRNGLVVAAYKNLLLDKQALCFAVDVKHTEELAKRFQDEGVLASYVTGAMPDEERVKTLEDFSTKKINVVVNCLVLTEGFDEPSIDAILMARPTQSGLLFQQMLGRGTRTCEGKEFLTVVDFVDNTYKQTIRTTASLLGIPGNVDFKGRDILSVKEDLDKLLELAPSIDLEKLDIDKIKYAIEEVDLLSGLKIPDQLSTFTTYDWHKYGEDTYRIGLGTDISILIKQSLTSQWVVAECKYDHETHKETYSGLGEWGSLEGAIKSADYYINKYHRDKVILVKESAKWRKDQMTPKQVDILQKFRVNPLVMSQLDKGTASRLITKLINNSRLKR